MIRTSLILIVFIALIGCSQNQYSFKVDHPGSYELIRLGNKQVGRNDYQQFKAHEKIFYSAPGVLPPTFFSVFLLEHTTIKEGESVLDIGTGTGIQAIYAAENARHVLATDISDRALEITMVNARLHDIQNKISVRKSDLFNNIKPSEKFDVIISSIPYAWNEQTQNNWDLHVRFFKDIGKHLNPEGRLYFLTGLLKNLPRTRELVESNGLKIMRVDMAFAPRQNLEPIVYMIQHKPEIPDLSKDKTDQKPKSQ